MSLLTGKSGVFLHKSKSNIFITRALNTLVYDDIYSAITGRNIFAGIGSFGFDDIYEALTGKNIFAGMEDPAEFNDVYYALTGKSIFAGMDDPSGFDDVYTALTGRSIFAGISDDYLYDDIYNSFGSNSVYAGLEDPNYIDDTYLAATGEDVYTGNMKKPVGIPKWRLGMQINEWKAIPQKVTLASLDPALNPNLNPVYPSSPEFAGWSGFASVVNAWCGACYDDTTGYFSIPLSGGHTDRAGNEPFRTNVFDDSTTWKMIRPPSGAKGNELITRDNKESTGLYSDGRLRAVHSYNYPVACPDRMFIAALPAIAWSGQTEKKWLCEIDHITGEYTLIADYSNLPIGYTYGGACWDSKRNNIFICGRGVGKFITVNLDTKVASAIGISSDRFSGYPRPVYAKELDRVLVVSIPAGQGSALLAKSGLTIVNPETGVNYYPNILGEIPAELNFDGCGACWDGSSLLIWNNESNAQKLFKLTPPSDGLDTSAWTITSIEGTGDNPKNKNTRGTYGRLQYSEKLGGVLLMNSVESSIYFMRVK